MEIKEILLRVGYVRNYAKLSARELSLRIGKSQQYIAKIENGKNTLNVKTLLQILEVCNFPIERFFSANIQEYNANKELQTLIENLPIDKKQNIIDFIKK